MTLRKTLIRIVCICLMTALMLSFVPNTTIAVTRRAPMGDPIELQLRGYVLTLRLEDAKAVEVEVLS